MVLLLDEPFGALNAIVCAELRGWLRRLHDEQGTTTVLVTPDQEEAMEVAADRIAVMSAGRIEQVGSPRDIYWLFGDVKSTLGAAFVSPPPSMTSCSRASS